MNALRLFLLSPLVERLGWGLLHFLWQGAVIAALLAVALRVLRNRSPNARYLAGWVALAAMACAVPLTAWLVMVSPAPAPKAVEEAATTEELSADTSTKLEPARMHSMQNWPQQGPKEAVLPPATDLATQPAVESLPTVDLGLAARVSLALRPALPWLVGGWLAGTLLIALWHLGGWWQVGRLRRVATREAPDAAKQMLSGLLRRFALRGPVKLLVSARVAVPTLIGWLRPVILVPASVLAGLPPQQLELILAHELAHLRRCDYLLNLVQTAIETLLFYHPAVWWVSRQIRVERESCCDEQAAAAGDRLAYARALASLAELCRQPRLASPGLALGADGGSLSARIRRVLGLPSDTSFPTARSAGAILAMVAILAITVGFHLAARPSDAGQPSTAESTEHAEAPRPASLDEDRRTDQERLERAELATPGHVADAQGHGVAKATVEQVNSSWSATTDARGKFPLPELKLGETAQLRVSAAGFLPIKDDSINLLREFKEEKVFWKQREVGKKLIALGDKSVVPELARMLTMEDRAARCNAGWVLAGLGDDRGLFAVIAEMKDRSPRPADPGGIPDSHGLPSIENQIRQDRYYAAHVLGDIGDRRAVPALIEALQDESINYEAACVLAHLGDQRAVPGLLAALERAQGIGPKSVNTDMRLWAGYGLMGLRHPLGLRTSAEFLKGGHDDELRRLYTADAASQRVFAEAARMQRRFAAEALAEFGGRDAVPFLIEAASQDKDAGVRVNAIVGLGKIGDEAAAAALRGLLDDGSGEKGLARLRYEPPLFKQMTVREAASQALEQIKSAAVKQGAETSRSELTVDVSGRVVDDATGPPVGQFVVQGGRVDDSLRAAAKPSADEVRRRIAALAAPDETVPYDEQAVNWLSKRREQIVGQLIAGLDDKNPKVAEQCLNILYGVPARQELTDALIAKAGDAKSPLRYGALRQLEKSAADPRVARLLDQASTQVASFPDLLVRARWAWLAGHKDRAVDILKLSLQKLDDSRFEHVEAIRLLSEIGGPGSVELLRPIAAGDNWGLAAEAYQALAKIDPTHHGLTKDQATLLEELSHHFKESSESFHRRVADLAKLNAREVRPLLMQMLRDTGYGGQIPALLILTAWKDKEALPQIRRLMQDKKRSYLQPAAVAAYLAIDDGQQAQDDVLDLLAERDEFANEAILAGVVTAAIPVDRKLTILRAARVKLESPTWVPARAVPHALRYSMNRGQDIRELLVPLMDKETNLFALADYCGLAAADKEKRFAPQVRRAMELFSSAPMVSAADDHLNSGVAQFGQVILEAVATYDLKDLAPHVRKLMSSRNATIRDAAQAAGARLGIAGAMQDLYAQLGAEDVNVRKLAAKSLMDVPPVGAAKRAAREEAVLACLGKPSEDYALRILATCGGEKTANALAPILDGPDARRAVYAAWVLAQLPDQAAAAKALRRVAIFALFHHQVYQQGAGIDFQIAPDLYFHQVTGRLNRDPQAYTAGEGPVQIPGNLLAPFAWDDGEQQYAVRCYQLAEVSRDGYGPGLDVDFLARGPIGPPNRMGLDRTHVLLLKEIAAHDSHLERLMVKGQAVAHFPYRQRAAQAIAAVTGEKAAYRGLSGEKLQSDAFPEPYPDQDALLARFFVDRVQKAQLRGEPQTDRQWQQLAIYRQAANRLQELFGPQVVDAIRQEAKQRAVGLKHILPEVQPAKEPSAASPAGPPTQPAPPQTIPAKKEPSTASPAAPPAAVEQAAETPRSEATVDVSGQVVDDATGRPVEEFVVQGGRVDDKDPAKITWGYSEGRTSLPNPEGRFLAEIQWGGGGRARILAAGYLPQPILEKAPAAGVTHINGHVVRLRRGRKIAGRVLYHDGTPAAGVSVFLLGERSVLITAGKAWQGPFSQATEDRAITKTTTDSAGRFRLPGSGGDAKTIVVSTPRLDVWAVPEPPVDAKDADLAIQLPEPGRLVVHFDIAGGDAQAKFLLELHCWNMPGWHGLENTRQAVVSNRGQLVFENLPPGQYELTRQKSFTWGTKLCDRRTVIIESGKTVTSDFVRRHGAPVQGQIAGLKPGMFAGNTKPGVIVTVRPAAATGDPRDVGELMLTVFDVLPCGLDGRFQTERLLPGKYAIIAEAYLAETPQESIATGWRSAFVGRTEVTVPEDGLPPQVTVELRPLEDKPPVKSDGGKSGSQPSKAASKQAAEGTPPRTP